jgi:hypothetical protein
MYYLPLSVASTTPCITHHVYDTCIRPARVLAATLPAGAAITASPRVVGRRMCELRCASIAGPGGAVCGSGSYRVAMSRLDRQTHRGSPSGLFPHAFPVLPQPHLPCAAMRQRLNALRTRYDRSSRLQARNERRRQYRGEPQVDEACGPSRCGVQAGPTSRSPNPHDPGIPPQHLGIIQVYQAWLPCSHQMPNVSSSLLRSTVSSLPYAPRKLCAFWSMSSGTDARTSRGAASFPSRGAAFFRFFCAL